ncbi:EF-P lysine aminoacylase EpmA [Stratiformator vulcanicus]|uniref:Elongation factor P--(R)-beta-lysine ligase n=1 Tax=Stratiformator vulcanicus TaxID=2527980 RepID=A0A517R1Y4_9PLAN|nr:EF-P lysine aminoacylase EpmA [Stratiformator vulcanicus]QDT37890.1 Elongation factor P--(R)-beta-lysine ligase [Stratiformator vulcanicus]
MSGFVHSDDWRPTTSFDTLRLRAQLLARVREFFRERGYLEVETPLLSRDVVIDTHIDPLTSTVCGERRFLQTSPEFAMKRLLAAGSGPIFQVCKAFRDQEHGARHNPEFTMIEWYAPHSTYFDQMTVTEALVRELAASTGAVATPRLRIGPEKFDRISYIKAFREATNTEILNLNAEALMDLTRDHQLVIPESLDSDEASIDEWRNLLLAELVEPNLGLDRPAFLYDYPATQAALARLKPDGPRVAMRFELYIDGVEICNGYDELLDPAELRVRGAEQNRCRSTLGKPVMPEESRLLDAMDSGLPNCSGVALGFDRLLAVLLGKTSLHEVMPFPFERA